MTCYVIYRVNVYPDRVDTVVQELNIAQGSQGEEKYTVNFVSIQEANWR